MVVFIIIGLIIFSTCLFFLGMVYGIYRSLSKEDYDWDDFDDDASDTPEGHE